MNPLTHKRLHKCTHAVHTQSMYTHRHRHPLHAYTLMFCKFYMRTPLHTDTVTHRHHSHTDTFYKHTLKFLHTKPFTHRRLYAHTDTHTLINSIYMQMFSRTGAFTHRNVCTQMLTLKHFYARTFLHTDTFYTQTLLHTKPLTDRRPSHRETRDMSLTH